MVALSCPSHQQCICSVKTLCVLFSLMCIHEAEYYHHHHHPGKPLKNSHPPHLLFKQEIQLKSKWFKPKKKKKKNLSVQQYGSLSDFSQLKQFKDESSGLWKLPKKTKENKKPYLGQTPNLKPRPLLFYNNINSPFLTISQIRKGPDLIMTPGKRIIWCRKVDN